MPREPQATQRQQPGSTVGTAKTSTAKVLRYLLTLQELSCPPFQSTTNNTQLPMEPYSHCSYMQLRSHMLIFQVLLAVPTCSAPCCFSTVPYQATDSRFLERSRSQHLSSKEPGSLRMEGNYTLTETRTKVQGQLVQARARKCCSVSRQIRTNGSSLDEGGCLTTCSAVTSEENRSTKVC